MQEIFVLFVAFGEAVRSKGSTKFGGVQVLQCSDVRVDVGAHDDFRFRGGLAKKSVEGVEEAEVYCVITCLRAWMVDRGKGEGKLLLVSLNCNDKYDYQLMRLAEDYFFLLFNSVAHGAFPPFENIIAQNSPYRVLSKLFVVPSLVHNRNLVKPLSACPCGTLNF